MKKIVIILVVILVQMSFYSSVTYAQDNQRPYLVTIYNMVSMNDMAKVNNLVDSVLTPILKEMVDEKMLYSFGQFTHAWGDEWNMNFWYIAKDLSSFEKFWGEYMKRVNERHPKVWAELTGYIKEHKDNIYRIRGQYPQPTQH